MTAQITLTPAAREAIAANAPYAKARRAAYLRLARRIVANPEHYTAEDLADAEMVLRPTLPEQGVA